MCGIIAVLGAQTPIADLRKRIVALATKIRHRGPDWSGIHVQGQNVFAHERLAIVDLANGAQPLFNEDRSVVLVVNGEIYNHKQLEATELKTTHTFRTKSDCEVLLHLFEDYGFDFVDKVQGDFAFVVSDGKKFMAARDPIGVCPLYLGHGKDGSVWFASEMKALLEDCEHIEIVPPGHAYTSEAKTFVPYYKPQWQKSLESREQDGSMVPRGYPEGSILGSDASPEESKKANDVEKLLREKLEQAVVRRMMTDTPYGLLLSGGLDSSLVAAITARHARKRMEEDFETEAWWPRLHTFCIGVNKDSPDMKAAREVADYLKSVHHEFYFDVQDGIDAVEQVIWHLETFDVTTIRASTPMYLLSRRIKALGVKMVLSGEGSDEIFGGYLYFYNAPDRKSFYDETVRRLNLLHTADCLRANKSTAAWGLEVRVPFLDKDFIEAAMSVDPADKMCYPGKRMEKYILRKAFDLGDETAPSTDDNARAYLPKSVLWRQKEQFSDGVGYSWIDSLKTFAESEVSDEDWAKREVLFPDSTPQTPEAFFYRRIFDRLFPHGSAVATVNTWIPTWSKSTDPSGRAQTVHLAATETEAPTK